VNYPWGAGLQSRAHVVDEYNYIITLANNSKPFNKHIIKYEVREGQPCYATPTGGQVVRRSHKLTVTFGNWIYVSTINQ
jgi:hypothetical protein